MSHGKIFQTADIGLAAALTCYGYSIQNFNREYPKRVLFEFEKTDFLMDCVSEYWENGLLLPAIQMATSLKTLKTRLYAKQ